MTHRREREDADVVLEMRGPIDEAEEAPWPDADRARSADRILLAIDGFDRDRSARDRSRTVGMCRVFVLLIGIALVLAVVMTLNQLITDAVHGIDQGLDAPTQQPG